MREIGSEEKRKVVTFLCEQIELIQRRPGTFLGRDDDPWLALAFFQGLNLFGESVGIRYSRETLKAALESRGWEFRAQVPWDLMREKGMSDAEIVQEEFNLEVLKWRLYLDALE